MAYGQSGALDGFREYIDQIQKQVEALSEDILNAEIQDATKRRLLDRIDDLRKTLTEAQRA